MSRRLPVYILVDCSESMAGPGLDGLRTALSEMVSSLRRNPYALETVWISFISFSHGAKVIAPLTPLEDVQVPRITLSPGTAMGAALMLATSCIRNEVRKGTSSQKGDFRPLVFLITDGTPTDDVRKAAKELRLAKCVVNSVGCGIDIDWHLLGSFSDTLINLTDPRSEGLVSAFRWISSSIVSASSAPLELEGDEGKKYGTSELGEGLEKVDLTKAPRHDGVARQIFIQSWCQHSRAPYLIRLRLNQDGRTYNVAATHKLESEMGAETGGLAAPAVDNRLLFGAPVCPYCESGASCHCENCRSIFCLSTSATGVITCPRCGHRGQLGQGRFDVQQRQG